MQTSASDLTRPVGSKRYRGERSELVKYGKELWTDTSLSTNGLSCNSCHMNNLAFLASFTKQYPHEVAMAKGMGIHSIQIDEMVQLCMVNPMANKPLPWDSRELASLSAYSVDVAQRNYMAAVATNPCMVVNMAHRHVLNARTRARGEYEGVRLRLSWYRTTATSPSLIKYSRRCSTASRTNK